jgi:hypothetical protein
MDGSARKKESLQRVLDGSRSDLQRLQQRLGALVGAWESDAPLPAEEHAPGDEALPAAAVGAAPVEAVADAGDWPLAIDHLRLTVNAGLPADEARAGELAGRLGRLADRLAAEGPSPDALQSLDATCAEIRRLFAHRQHLVEQLGRLCTELGQGLTELAEDESWARGQAQRCRRGWPSGLKRAQRARRQPMLAETPRTSSACAASATQARDALKQLIHACWARWANWASTPAASTTRSASTCRPSSRRLARKPGRRGARHARREPRRAAIVARRSSAWPPSSRAAELEDPRARTRGELRRCPTRSPPMR